MRKLFIALTAFLIAVLLIAPASAIVGVDYIYVDSNVYGADVYIDGSYYGTTPNNFEVAVTGNAYSVEVSESGYYPYSTYAYAGGNVYATLTPYNPVPPQPVVYSATLALTTYPAGAEVYVDNVYKGYTPITLTDLSSGYHTVSAELYGYGTWSEQIYFSEGDYQTRNINLQETPVPTPSPAPVFALIAGLGAAAFFALRRE